MIPIKNEQELKQMMDEIVNQDGDPQFRPSLSPVQHEFMEIFDSIPFAYDEPESIIKAKQWLLQKIQEHNSTKG